MREVIDTPAVIIFSVFQSKLTEQENLANHWLALEVLNNRGIDFKTVDGVYKGVSERSILVLNTMDNFDVVSKLTKQYSQESVLLSDANRDTQLLFLKSGQVESIGKLTAVSESEAKARDAYTYDAAMGMYWVTK